MLTAHVLSPAVKYLFKLNNKVNTVSIVNFEQVNSGWENNVFIMPTFTRPVIVNS